MFKEKRGITLIALVVTIIVLLILAGVSITMVAGDNGIATKGKNSSIKTENGKVFEILSLKATDINLDDTIEDSEELVINQLIDKGYINSDLTVNVNTVTGENLQTGNGTLSSGDIYYLKEISSRIYNLIYLDSNKKETDLGTVIYEKDVVDYSEYFEINENGYLNMKQYYSFYNSLSLYGDVKYKSNWIGEGERNFPEDITKIVVPDTIDGVKVVGLCTGVFFNLKNVTEVVLPEGIEYISNTCFSDCTSLKEITIPNSVETIGWWAFDNCTSLKEITIPSSVKSIDYRAFYGWTSDQTINVYFSEGEMGTGWLIGCNAKINYNYGG